MKNIVDNLEATGKVIIDSNIVYYILGGFGLEFDLVSKNRNSRINDVTLTEIYSRLLAYESKLHDYNTSIIINIGENNVNSSSYANNVVKFSSYASSNRFNINLSIDNFGDCKSNNAGFVWKNINDFNFVNFIR